MWSPYSESRISTPSIFSPRPSQHPASSPPVRVNTQHLLPPSESASSRSALTPPRPCRSVPSPRMTPQPENFRLGQSNPAAHHGASRSITAAHPGRHPSPGRATPIRVATQRRKCALGQRCRLQTLCRQTQRARMVLMMVVGRPSHRDGGPSSGGARRPSREWTVRVYAHWKYSAAVMEYVMRACCSDGNKCVCCSDGEQISDMSVAVIVAKQVSHPA